MTTCCAVVGSPIAHSLSPAIHRRAFALLGLDWTYEAYDLTPEAFDAFVGSRSPEWRGLSITMPLKEPALRWGEASPDVALTGAANTLVWHGDGRRTLANTDVPGLLDALATSQVGAVGRAVLIGSGATARSSLLALSRLGIRRVDVTGRTPERVAETCAWASTIGLDAGPLAWGGALPVGTELLLSTVPAGGMDALIAEGALELPDSVRAVFDVSYHPWPTRLAQAAAAAGTDVLNGLDLLVHQAVHQIRLFTGSEVPPEPLFEACRTALRERSALVGD